MALAVAAAALGKGLELDFPPHRVRGNCAILVVAPSGIGKSAIFKQMCAPLYYEEKRIVEEHKATLPTLLATKHRLDHEAAQCKKFSNAGDEAKLAEIIRKQEKLELKMATPRLLADDANVP